MNTLVRFGLRSAVGRPGRTLLTILSVVIGVAAFVAVTISTRTTREAYKTMFSAVTGKAALEVSGEGNEGFPQTLVEDLEKLVDEEGKPPVQIAAPLIYRPCMLIGGQKQVDGETRANRVKAYVLGIDTTRDAKVRDFKINAGKGLSDIDDVLMDSAFARKLGVKVGDEVKLVGSAKGIIRLNVAGIVTPGDGSGIRYGGMAIVSLAKAQEVFNLQEKVDRIQLLTAPEMSEAHVKNAVEAGLPPGLRIAAPAVNTEVMKETLLSSEEALKFSRLFTVLLGIFIIFNTFLMNLGERRRQLSVVRAIGGTRGQLVTMLVGESIALGLIGSALGVLTGFGGAMLLNWANEQLVQVPLPPTPFTMEPVLTGFGFGMLVALVGVMVPAMLVYQVTPLEGMRDAVSTKRRSIVPYVIASGITVIVVCTAITWLSIMEKLPLWVASPAGVGLVFGYVLAAPLVMEPLSRAVTWLLRPFMRFEAGLALRQLLRHKLRTSLTMGVLFVAGSAGVGMASSLLDSVDNVRKWSRTAIVGDFFIRSMLPDTVTGLSAPLPDIIEQELTGVTGIDHADTVSFVSGRIKEQPIIVVVRSYGKEEVPPFDLVEGDPATLRKRLFDGDVVVGSVLAQRLNLKLDQELPLAGKEGEAQNVRIAAIANDYLVGGMSVYLQRVPAEKLLGVSGVNAYIIRASADKREHVRKQLEDLTDKHEVLLQSYTDLTTMIDGMIRGVDACLWGLVTLGFVVAAFGVVNTLTMNVLEQTRELGLLRITGMTRRQVLKTIVAQAVIMGIVGATPGIAAGIGTAYMMNLAMQPKFGHNVEFQIHPSLLFMAWLGSMVVTLIAAWVPARRAAGLDVVDALHYE